jgi:hypothetical protein
MKCLFVNRSLTVAARTRILSRARHQAVALLLAALTVLAAPVAESSLPNETLHYSINWPSGLSLGEAQLSASSSHDAKGPERMHFRFDIDAGIPSFAVSDHFQSDASGNFCSAEFHRVTSHGPKKTDEKTTFDQSSGAATRQTTGGGKAELSIPSCGKDALAFLYFVRQELSQGRIPPRQTVFYGASYGIRLESVGTESIKIGNTAMEADHLKASVTGPSSSISFEAFFLKDRARTPALVRVPLALGTFSMELEK